MAISFVHNLQTELILATVERVTSEYNNYSNKDQSERIAFYHNKSRNVVSEKNPFTEKNSSGLSEAFTNYLKKLHLENDPDTLVLSSSSHYYYESEELKKVKTLVNLKQLNHITQLNEFLNSVFCILPPESYLIGCFSDNKNQYRFFSDSHKPQNKISGQFDLVENGISSRIPFLNMIYSIMDTRTNRYMTKSTVMLHLEEAELKVLDMTEINGLTFFCAQKNHSYKKDKISE
jgi:hypothetical protein